MALADVVEECATREQFSGVVRIDRAGTTIYERAFGFADRAYRVENTVDMQFAVASIAKGFTALVVMRLVELGRLTLATRARDLLGADLPLIDDAVTIEQLLAHRSGIGDHLDESGDGAITDYAVSIPVHELVRTEDHIRQLAGKSQVFAPGTQFAYNNGAFLVLALLAERASGTPFTDLVDEHVVRPAQLTATAFLRSDELAAGVARGYLFAGDHPDRLRTNVLHLPVVGNGDGGIYTTAADLHALWRALAAGRVVQPETFALMTEPRSTTPSGKARYGLGFWLAGEGPGVELEGYDAGASARTTFDPASDTITTVLGNWSDAAWPLLDALIAAGYTS